MILSSSLRSQSEVTGMVRAEPRSPGGYELTATSFKILHRAENYPITPKEHGPDFLMNNRHLWIRSKLQHAVLRVRAEVVAAIRDFFDGRVRLPTLQYLLQVPARVPLHFFKPNTLTKKPIFHKVVNSIWRPLAQHSERFTALAQHFAQKNPKLGDI